MKTSESKGTITIELEGVDFATTEKLRHIIHTLFTEGVFSVKNGKATLNFDREGNLNSIELHYTKWHHKGEPSNLHTLFESVTITSPDSIKERATTN